MNWIRRVGKREKKRKKQDDRKRKGPDIENWRANRKIKKAE
jgi:hypothetical protein